MFDFFLGRFFSNVPSPFFYISVLCFFTQCRVVKSRILFSSSFRDALCVKGLRGRLGR